MHVALFPFLGIYFNDVGKNNFFCWWHHGREILFLILVILRWAGVLAGERGSIPTADWSDLWLIVSESSKRFLGEVLYPEELRWQINFRIGFQENVEMTICIKP